VSTPVLATKLFAPAMRGRLVTRPRLLADLDGTLDAGHRLTLVSAPAGFGKTTLLSAWTARLGERRPPAAVAWVSLDDGDNDLGRLLAHTFAALRRAGLDIDTAALESLRPEPGYAAVALSTLVNEVARAGDQEPDRRWILALDDYHAITSPEVHEAVSFLLDNMPAQLHLLIATRSDPPLPLARLRSRGQLVERRAADLRFTPTEAAEFLNTVMELDLTAADVQALDERTEGWAVGLQLAALSLRGVADRRAVAGFIDAFTGSHRFVIDYLADEVLARQPVTVRDFLLRTSILDRLSGELCDAVTAGTGSARTLADLDRSNLFVLPLDDRRSWYRYHHLFADVLRARLHAEQPDEVAELHRRASAWYAAHSFAEDAVRHAVAGQDFDRAAYLVEEGLADLSRTRQDGLLLRLLRSLPERVVHRSPVLSMSVGWSYLLAGDLDGLESRLDDAERALAAGAADPDLRSRWADTEELRTAPATIAVYRASLAQARGDVPGTVRHARRALELAGPDDHRVRGGGAGFLGLAAWAAGDVEEALSTYGEAVASLHAAGNLIDELDTTISFADMWVTAGRPGRARRLLEQALQTATGRGEPYPRATADLHTGLAELDRESGDLTAAQAHLETARALAERSFITENQHRWFLAMADLRAATGDFAAAHELIEHAAGLYLPGFYPDVRPIPAVRARLHIADGDLSAAATWADDAGVTVDDDADYLHEYEHLTLVRLLLARHRAASGSRPPAVLGMLTRLEAAASRTGRHRSVLEIRLLRALAHHAAGDMPTALTTLAGALAEAPEVDSYVRLFLDERDPVVDLLRHAATSTDHGPLPAHARRLLRHVAPAAPAGRQPLPDPLSQRELEVLRLLDSELTGPEIARQLYVSVNTLRTHTKRIFTKLDVTTRAAAVRRAHDRGLL
jgi:LuxR family maltose regulon positive regulatory protein